MVIREREYKKCGECGRSELVKDQSFGCDNCQKEIDLSKNQSYLNATVFSHNNEAEDMNFCSWVCVLKKMQTVKTDHFITLPYLSFDGDKQDGCSGTDFWKAIRFGLKDGGEGNLSI